MMPENPEDPKDVPSEERDAASAEPDAASAEPDAVSAEPDAVSAQSDGAGEYESTPFILYLRQVGGQLVSDRRIPGPLLVLFVVLLLGLGAFFRFQGVNWDADKDGQSGHLHPDERHMAMVATALRWPDSFSDYIHESRSTLNPRNMGKTYHTYGTLPTTIVRGVADGIDAWKKHRARVRAGDGIPSSIGPSLAGYDHIHLVGRVLAGCFDLGTLLFVFLIALRLYRNQRVALLAAFLYACCVLSIQHAHFFVVDSFAVFFIAGSLYFLVGAWRHGRTIDYAVAGAFFGMAMASKLSIYTFGAIPVLVALQRAWRRRAKRPTPERTFVALLVAGLHVALFVAVSFAFFRVGSPDVFLGRGLPQPEPGEKTSIVRQLIDVRISQRWKTNVDEVKGINVTGERAVPFTQQWANRSTFGFPWWHMVVWGMGPPLGLAAWIGLVVAAWLLFRHGWWVHLIPVAWSVILFYHQATLFVKTMRYWLPIYPTLIILAAWLLIWLLRPTRKPPARGHRKPRPLPPPPAESGPTDEGPDEGEVTGAAREHAVGAESAEVAPESGSSRNAVGAGSMLVIAPDGTASEVAAGAVRGDGEWPTGSEESPGGQGFAEKPHETVVEPDEPRAPGASPADAEPPRRGRLWWRRGVACVLVFVALATFLWALAFTSVYRRPHSRIQASRWIFENIPEGSTIAGEHWDDQVPLRIDGKNPFGSMYTGLQMEWYEADTQSKLSKALGWLDRADYIVLSSNRLYDVIPRQPARYPMTTLYYQALFDGSLGFAKIVDVHCYPRLFGIAINDQSAEEAFHVYDHPRVQIFRKAETYRRERAAEILGNVDFENVLRVTARQIGHIPNGLMLPGDRLAGQRVGGTWTDIFAGPDSLVHRWPLLPWVLVLELLALVAWPYLFLVGRTLPDRGLAFAHTLGIFLTTWLMWFAASFQILPFGRGPLYGVVLMWGVGAAAIVLLHGREMLRFARERWGLLLFETVLFYVFFAGMVLIRMGNPDLWHPSMGGEKPMDLAYLTAVTKSTSFPPYDPWFSGGYMNYYYWGWVMVASLLRMTAIVPTVAFNLAVPTFFALTAMGAFGVVLALLHRPGRPRVRVGAVAGATLGSVLTVIAGNFGELRLLLDGFTKHSRLAVSGPEAADFFTRAGVGLKNLLLKGYEQWRESGDWVLMDFDWWHRQLHFRQEWWYWNATRAIEHAQGEAPPITEFPFFTFLYADLHPHLMALPLTLLILGVAVAFVRRLNRRPATDYQALLDEAPALAVGGLAIGALWPTNAWDFPTYAVLFLAALGIREWARAGGITIGAIVGAGVRWAFTMGVAVLAFLPFRMWYGAGYTKAELWKGSRTPLDDYLIIHGLFLFLILMAMLADFLFGPGQNGFVWYFRCIVRRIWRPRRLWRLIRRDHAFKRRRFVYRWGVRFTALLLAALLAGAWALNHLGYGPPAVALLVMTPAILLLLRRRPDPLWQMALVMVLMALSLTIAVEIIVLRGDISRMNTVFKFYLQVWVLLAAASAVGSVRVWRLAPRRAWLVRIVWCLGFIPLLGTALLYPRFATEARIKDRFEGSKEFTLDGAAFLDVGRYGDHYEGENRERLVHYELKWDAEAFEWMQQNVAGSPVVVEANTRPKLYGWGSRYAMFTGLPTVAGWGWHQHQQRAVLQRDPMPPRMNDLERIYRSTDLEEVRGLLGRYDVEYLVVGPLERIFYRGAGLNKFAEQSGKGDWERVFENAEVQIFRVLDPGRTPPDAAAADRGRRSPLP